MRLPRALSGLSVGRLLALFGALMFIPLALLAYASMTLADDAVSREVEARIGSTASLSAAAIGNDLQGLVEVVESYATRPSLRRALELGEARADGIAARHHLAELRGKHPGIYTTFLARPDGRLIEIVPATPEIVGDDFSFRDWYKGVRARDGTYVSEAYRTQARGRPLVVAAATPVRSAGGEMLAILVAAYGLDHIQQQIDTFAAAQDVRLDLTDQKGTLVASTERAPRSLVSLRSDPRVQSALLGNQGVRSGGDVSAFQPVPAVRWAVLASVPSDTAFAAVHDLKRAVMSIAAALGLVLLLGLALLGRTLRQRRRAETELERTAGIMRAVLDATPDGIGLVDLEGRRVLGNAAMERVSPTGASGRSAYERATELGDTTTTPERVRDWFTALGNEPEREDELDIEWPDGRAFRLYAAPVRAGGDLIGRIFVVRERTTEKEAERLKDELVATVSHELRTPLAGVLGFAELLAENEVDPETQQRYLQTIHGEARRLTALINDFLDLQRMESGSFTLSIAPFDVGELLRREVELFSGQSTSHKLVLDLPERPLRAAGDSERLDQVVANLLSNAIKYSPEGGVVTVRAEENPNGVRVSVSDSGLGIPADQREGIFGKFFRIDSSDTRRIGGTGLGLSLSRDIVHAHGGRIGFDSVEGEGSTFWFELPAAVSSGGATGPDRVLVVEDDPAAAELLAEHLRSDGRPVEIVATGEEALARVQADPPAAVCLDVELAGELDGWRVLEQLKHDPSTADVPVVICTGRNGRDRAGALGAADFVTKPFTRTRIQEAVERLLPEREGSVLVVDDEEHVRRLVADTLRSLGFGIREARDGEEALAAIAGEPPDAIVLDLVMPRLDGFGVLDRLREDPATSEIPVLVLTARRLSPEERNTIRVRARSVIEKGAYSADELRRLVRQALGETGQPVGARD